MKYIKRVEINEIINKYDNIIGWGVGPIFRLNYQPDYFKIDFLIDGTEKRIGEIIKGIEVLGRASLNNINSKSLIIIYAIYEKEIIEQIEQLENYSPDVFDIIIYSLLNIRIDSNYLVPEINSKNCEDLLCIMLLRQLGLETIQYLEIGVCHPIMRNNTYMLYENYSEKDNYKGVLVEANPLCWDLINEYRPNDILLRGGVGNEAGKLPFYMFPHLLGHSTFSKELAQQIVTSGNECVEVEIDVKNINTIIEENFNRTPDLLALDAEGLDYEILKSWNDEKHPFKIVICEKMDDICDDIKQLMHLKGYNKYAETIENYVWIRKDYEIFV